MNLKNLALFTILVVASILVSGDAKQDPLQILVYNPLNQGFFPVSSSLIYTSDRQEAILLDAQFSTRDGKNLAELVKKTAKNLKRIIITCGRPDFYFGLEPIIKTFPNVDVVANSRVVKFIRDSKDANLAAWQTLLRQDSPREIYVPDVLPKFEYELSLGGQRIEMRWQDNNAAYVWIPGSRAIVGGCGVYWGTHVPTYATQTPKIRASWRNVLRGMIALKPRQVVPGHYLGKRPAGDEAVRFTLEYLEVFERVLRENFRNSTAVINSMKKAYPYLKRVEWLELSAAVNTGEVDWSLIGYEGAKS